MTSTICPSATSTQGNSNSSQWHPLSKWDFSLPWREVSIMEDKGQIKLLQKMCPWLHFSTTQIQALLRVHKGSNPPDFHTGWLAYTVVLHTQDFICQNYRGLDLFISWGAVCISNVFRLDKDTGETHHTYILKIGFSISRRDISIRLCW